MIELLAGIMIGDLTSPEVLDYLGTTTLAPFHGELIVAFSPEAFAKGRPGDPSSAPKCCSTPLSVRAPACPPAAALPHGQNPRAKALLSRPLKWPGSIGCWRRDWTRSPDRVEDRK